MVTILHQLVLGGLGDTLHHAADAHEVTQHQHADKSGRIGQQQGDDDGDHDGEHHQFRHEKPAAAGS